ncbi:aminotransferase class V-fold PLP-dependent enzyme [Dyella tabacisoli]|uniref:Aminotransferase class V-fold PLP-dependent enzyme n=1 Tax=Dyella tabacisoli TaxID=2282381 RepID=A0A369UTC7_9GAMM|nr:aminotransferase class V-fold PLP-dependent enzyme [Dyella tabacisoli]RDD83573.1 aminotransferase class V-fold PLP-dependent enzyme [Dyella tabacisoli]
MIPVTTLAHLRAQTPGLSDAVHLNHAGLSLPPLAAIDAIREHLALESKLGPMAAAAHVAERLDKARSDAATLLNADVDEIAFTSSCSNGFDCFFAAFPPLKPGERILVGRQEWGGSLAAFERAAQRFGASVEVIPTQADGSVDAQALAKVVDERVRLVSLTWLPANGGLINDAVAVGKVTRQAGIPYFIDAAQAVGQIPVDVKELQCDVLVCPGRKHLRGPSDTGILYVRRAFLEHLEPSSRDAPLTSGNFSLRADVRRFEADEQPIALLLGLAESIALALTLGAHHIAAEIAVRAQALRTRLLRVPGLTVHDLGEGVRSGLVSFNLRGHQALDLKSILAAEQIQIAANGIPFTPLDMRARRLDWIARASVSYLNTDEDVERLATALTRLA